LAEKPTDFKDPVEIDLVDTFSELSTSEEAKKGDLAVIEESPALPPESNWKKAGRVVGKVARAAARRNPLGLLIDSIVNWPTDEEVKENIEKGTKGSENILDDIATLVKGMKGEPMTRREVLRGGKAAAQVIGTPKPKLITDKVDTPIPVDDFADYESNFVNSIADKVFNIWKDNEKGILRNIHYTGNPDREPKKEDVSPHEEQAFEDDWRMSIVYETLPKKEVVDDAWYKETGEVFNRPRLIPDTRMEWDNSRKEWVWDYVDPPTSEEIKEAGRGHFSDWEHIIDEVYSGTDFETTPDKDGNKRYMDDVPYDSVGEMHYQEGMKTAKEFEKYIRMLKDKFGLQRYEIYDLWNLGARRYLDK